MSVAVWRSSKPVAQDAQGSVEFRCFLWSGSHNQETCVRRLYREDNCITEHEEYRHHTNESVLSMVAPLLRIGWKRLSPMCRIIQRQLSALWEIPLPTFIWSCFSRFKNLSAHTIIKIFSFGKNKFTCKINWLLYLLIQNPSNSNYFTVLSIGLFETERTLRLNRVLRTLWIFFK